MKYKYLFSILIFNLNIFNAFAQECDCVKIKARNADCMSELTKKESTVATQLHRIKQLEEQLRSGKGNESANITQIAERDNLIGSLQIAVDNLKKDTASLNLRLNQNKKTTPGFSGLKDSLGAVISNLRIKLVEQETAATQQQKKNTEILQEKYEEIEQLKTALQTEKKRSDKSFAEQEDTIKTLKKNIKDGYSEQLDRISDITHDSLRFENHTQRIENGGVYIMNVPFLSGQRPLDLNFTSKQDPYWQAKLARFKRLMYHYEGLGYKIKIIAPVNLNNNSDLAEKQAEEVRNYFCAKKYGGISLSCNPDDYKIKTETPDNYKKIETPTNYIRIFVIK